MPEGNQSRAISVLLLPRFEYPFIRDEITYLRKRNIQFHIIKNGFSHAPVLDNVVYHNLDRLISFQTVHRLASNFRATGRQTLYRPYEFFWDTCFVPSLVRIVEKNNLDLIHAHFAYPDGFMGCRVNEETLKPLVVSLHGIDILTEKSVDYGLRLNKKFRQVISQTLIKSDAIVAPSLAVFNEVLKIGVKKSKIHLIHEGVDTEMFSPKVDGQKMKQKLGISHNKMVILAVKSHEPVYGLGYLIKAFKTVIENNKEVVLVIVGDGSLRDFHERLAHTLKLDDDIIFISRIPHEEVPYYCAMSDISVNSPLQEAFGIIVAESMAIGKPVVATNVGGIPDQVIDGHNGFLVPPRDSQSLAEKIKILLDDSKMRVRMGRNGRNTVKRKFDMDKKIYKMRAMYESLIKC